MRVILLTLIFFAYHQAFALPVSSTSAEGSELQAPPVSGIDVPSEIATSQPLDSGSSSHDAIIIDRETDPLHRRQLSWTSSPVNVKVSVLVNVATATALQLANQWLSWNFKMQYQQNDGFWSGKVYTVAEASASDLSVCFNEFTPKVTGNTNGILWTEGEMVMEATWRSVPLSKSVTVFWKSSVRFYQYSPIPPRITSVVQQTIGQAWGYILDYTDEWVCTTTPADEPMIDILQTFFANCYAGAANALN